MVDVSSNMMTIRLSALQPLIRLYRDDAHIDVPELIGLTCRALEAGLDGEYAYRVHAIHTDVPQEMVKNYLVSIYKELCNVFGQHGLYVIYSLDVVKITHNSVVLLIDS